MIDLTNYEEYLMLRLDGELLPAEEAELEAFLAMHPELEGEVTAYATTVVAPEEDTLFEGKETLYKSVSRPFYTRPVMWAAAAVLLIAIGIKLAPEKNLPAVAVVPKKEIVAPVQPVVPPPQTVSVVAPPIAKVTVQIVSVEEGKKSQRLVEKDAEFPKEKITPAETPSAIVPLEAQSDQVIALGNVLPAEAQFQPVEVPEIAAVNPEKTPRFAVQLPLLNSIKEVAKTGFANVQSAGGGLRGSETTVMLFDRKLFTIRF